MRDSEIEQWVLNEIRLATNGRLKELCVFSANGAVSIRGTVRSRAAKLAVQKAAEQAKGVVVVINQLNLRRRRVADRGTIIINDQVMPASGTFPLPNQLPASVIPLTN